MSVTASLEPRHDQPAVTLSCKPGKENSFFVFPYAVHNLGGQVIYVMDAFMGVDPSTHAARALTNTPVVFLKPDGVAVIGKFPAPPPEDRRLALQPLPLAVRLEPGGAIERTLKIPEPLAEVSPCFPDRKRCGRHTLPLTAGL